MVMARQNLNQASEGVSVIKKMAEPFKRQMRELLLSDERKSLKAYHTI